MFQEKGKVGNSQTTATWSIEVVSGETSCTC